VAKRQGPTFRFFALFEGAELADAAEARSALKRACAELKKGAPKHPAATAAATVRLWELLPRALAPFAQSSPPLVAALSECHSELASVFSASLPASDVDPLLSRLHAALVDDEHDVLFGLARHFGTWCGSSEAAARWVARFDAAVAQPHATQHRSAREALLSALLAAGHYPRLETEVGKAKDWYAQKWLVQAALSQGDRDTAVAHLERQVASALASGNEDQVRQITAFAEQSFFEAGDWQTAYSRFARAAHKAATHVATFRAICKRYPMLEPSQILRDLAEHTPGEEGKWFAAAKDAHLFDLALELARRSPCNPDTLIRAAEDHRDVRPEFAAECGYLALHWLSKNRGFEVGSVQIWSAYYATSAAAERAACWETMRARLVALVNADSSTGTALRKALGRELGF
jgi:hypothetical protein